MKMADVMLRKMDQAHDEKMAEKSKEPADVEVEMGEDGRISSINGKKVKRKNKAK